MLVVLYGLVGRRRGAWEEVESRGEELMRHQLLGVVSLIMAWQGRQMLLEGNGNIFPATREGDI